MSSDDLFGEFFRKATGGSEPWPHQRWMAENGLPEALRADTGTGKTEAVGLAWIWRRLFVGDEAVQRTTPQKLVVALPTRSLANQTVDRFRRWKDNLGLGDDDLAILSVLGGEGWSDHAWRLAPNRPTVFIGSVDMVLSRALNRGFADSRWNWPISFGFFNNDVHWVIDEPQLAPVATRTTRQLHAFRKALGTYGPIGSTWMSATLRDADLRTVDAPDLRVLDLADFPDLPDELNKRLDAPRRIRRVPGVEATDTEAIAAFVSAKHRLGALTLVVMNRVGRARDLFDRLADEGLEAETILLHSRFRPPDREVLTRRLQEPCPTAGRIVVATQVLEAGVDLDADVLVTEVAPWSSIVQRLGRCNRGGRLVDAEAWWLPLLEEMSEKTLKAFALPYDIEAIHSAQKVLQSIEGTYASPRALRAVNVVEPLAALPVLRRKDLFELFDTTPDLGGANLDVSQLIRDDDVRDVYVAWRDVGSEGPTDGEPLPSADELCTVPITEARKFLESKTVVGGDPRTVRAWTTDHLNAELKSWVLCSNSQLRPGMTILVACSEGGYEPTRGWVGTFRKMATGTVSILKTSSDRASSVDAISARDIQIGADPASTIGCWQSLSSHLDIVGKMATTILDHGRDYVNAPPPSVERAVIRAGELHDVGKAYPAWQEAILASGSTEAPDSALMAKSDGRGRLDFGRDRRGLRHELVSLLALFGPGSKLLDGIDDDLHDLVRYLVAAHHGRIRLAVRRLPTDSGSRVDEVQVLGVRDGDTVPEVKTPVGFLPPFSVALDVLYGSSESEVADGESWTERTLELLDRPDLGPFRLAYLEGIVRIADWIASAELIEGV